MPPGRIGEIGRLFLTGEGSSRIFPAKNAICEVLRLGAPVGDLDRRRPAGPRVRSEPVRRLRGQQQRQDQGVDLAVHAAAEAGPRATLFGLSANSPCMLETCHFAVLHAPLRQGGRRGRHEERGRAGPVLSVVARAVGEGLADGGQPAAGRPEGQGGVGGGVGPGAGARRWPGRR